MTSSRVALALALVGVLAGCGSVAPPPPRASQPPRVRCLANPQETGTTRPLFFFFCVESP